MVHQDHHRLLHQLMDYILLLMDATPMEVANTMDLDHHSIVTTTMVLQCTPRCNTILMAMMFDMNIQSVRIMMVATIMTDIIILTTLMEDVLVEIEITVTETWTEIVIVTEIDVIKIVIGNEIDIIVSTEKFGKVKKTKKVDREKETEAIAAAIVDQRNRVSVIGVVAVIVRIVQVLVAVGTVGGTGVGPDHVEIWRHHRGRFPW